MAWDASRVNALWVTQRSLLGDPFLDYLKKYVDAFATIANAFEAAGAQIDDQSMALAMCNCNTGDNVNAIRRIFIGELEDATGIEPPPAASTVTFVAGSVVPTPPGRDPIPPRVLADRQRVAAMRSPQKTRRGAILARTARSLLGQWRWVDRAPDSILPYRGRRASQTQYTDIHAFDRWVQGGGPAPTGTTALNCRDAVLVTASVAGLLSHGELRAAYRAAEVQAKAILGDVLLDMQRTSATDWTKQQSKTGTKAYVAYVKRIDETLTAYPHAVPVKRKFGLIPQAGDVVFVRGSASALPDHVCLSLGRNRINGQLVDEVASLWHHNNGTFTRAKLTDMADYEDDLLYVPCPF
ncbi:hypothetical protein [Reyranella sp. CPCC 100927]|uniref:hypothetical protein n=1 Tax=Reyranella sp. CPCC 100927 TaxID=2599616 RepID=UPI0011B7A3B7|nr:hypothetical protein [Reyranella sp. CPCC 100927]TWT13845.1 hypothetical protein FQU96_08025 [Reyranella sp. CPCC 100927]